MWKACFWPGLRPSRSATTFTAFPSCVKRTVPWHLLPAVECKTATASLSSARPPAPAGSAPGEEELEANHNAATARLVRNRFGVFIGFGLFSLFELLPSVGATAMLYTSASLGPANSRGHSHHVIRV